MSLEVPFPPVARAIREVEQQLDRELELLLNTPFADARTRRYAAERIGHTFRRRGKLLRPALLLLSYLVAHAETGDGPTQHDRTEAMQFPQEVIRLAAGVELIHIASLVHDDVIDRADTRRGQPSVNRAYGNRTAVLVGDLIYAQFFVLLAHLPRMDHALRTALLALFGDTSRTMCYGELQEQMCLEEEASLSPERYLQILEFKTASLVSACCNAGALLAGAGKGVCDALAEFGRHLGIAFQLADDQADGDTLLTDEASLARRVEASFRQAEQALAGMSGGPAGRHLLELSRKVVRRQASGR